MTDTENNSPFERRTTNSKVKAAFLNAYEPNPTIHYILILLRRNV